LGKEKEIRNKIQTGLKGGWQRIIPMPLANPGITNSETNPSQPKPQEPVVVNLKVWK
jgi:hypothetical protein